MLPATCVWQRTRQALQRNSSPSGSKVKWLRGDLCGLLASPQGYPSIYTQSLGTPVWHQLHPMTESIWKTSVMFGPISSG